MSMFYLGIGSEAGEDFRMGENSPRIYSTISGFVVYDISSRVQLSRRLGVSRQKSCLTSRDFIILLLLLC